MEGHGEPKVGSRQPQEAEIHYYHGDVPCGTSLTYLHACLLTKSYILTGQVRSHAPNGAWFRVMENVRIVICETSSYLTAEKVMLTV